MKYTKNLLAALLLAMAPLLGCGSDSGSSVGTTPGEPDPAGYIGDVNCLSCHDDQKREWLRAHGNLAADGVTHNPSYPLPSATCEACHDRGSLTDPSVEGKGWELVGDQGPQRPVVSCEACHGAGGYHFGMGPLPRAIPGVETCIVCHNKDVPDDGMHRSTHIAEDYEQSKHAQSPALEGRETINAHCAMCHTDEGYIRYARAYNYDGDSQRNNLGYAWLRELFAERSAYGIDDVSPISCRTCHKPHSGELRAPETRDATGDVVFSQEFNTCTSCHQAFVAYDPTDPNETIDYFLDPDIYGGEFGLDWDDPENAGRLEYHNPIANPFGNTSHLIADTHFRGWFPRKNVDGSVTQKYVRGYYLDGDGLDPGGKNSCTVCHNPHSAAMGWIDDGNEQLR